MKYWETGDIYWGIAHRSLSLLTRVDLWGSPSWWRWSRGSVPRLPFASWTCPRRTWLSRWKHWDPRHGEHLPGFSSENEILGSAPPRTGVDFINCFCAFTPNFCASKKLFKKLGVGVGHKWIEQSLWFVPCAQLLLGFQGFGFLLGCFKYLCLFPFNPKLFLPLSEKTNDTIKSNILRLQHVGQSLHEHESDEKQSSQQRQNDSATIYYEVNKTEVPWE